MDEAAITRYITDSFDGVEIVVAEDDTYFFAGADRRLPFATLVTGDRHDAASNLSRPSVFRLNVGVGKQTYQSLFGSASSPSDGDNESDSGYDFTALDRLLPHPVYGRMHWVCVLNPSAATFETVRPLLVEAYERAVERERKVRSAAEP